MTPTCGNCVHHIEAQFIGFVICRAASEFRSLYCRPTAWCAFTPLRFEPIVVDAVADPVARAS